MNLIKNEVIKQLKSIQNKYNEFDYTDENIESYVDLVMNRSTNDCKESMLQHIMDSHYREFVKEYSHVIITKGKYGKHYIHIKHHSRLYSPMDIYVSKHTGNTIDDVYKKAEVFNTIYSNCFTTSEIKFPTGNIVFANFFKNSKGDDYAFEMPEEYKYKDPYSINHSFGEQATMQMLSDTHGLGFVQLGNTTAAVYKVTDDHIVITSAYLYWDDEEGYECEIAPPFDWELLGEISCDVWRVEFIDQQNFDKGDTLPLDHKNYQYNEPFKATVNPGKWQVKNRYHFMNDNTFLEKGEVPIWVDIQRIT